jgi:hypothetical protein
MRLSRIALVLSMISGLAVIPVSAAAASGCHWGLPTALPVPAGFTSTMVTATDGEQAFAGVAVSFAGGSYDPRAVVWQGGQVSVLPTPDGYSSEADGMNRLGDVVGYVAPTGGGARTPALWRAGMLIQLGTASPSNDAMAFDINDAGLIVGEVQEQPGIGDIQAVAWSADAPGTFSYVPGGSTTILYSVTEGGLLAGTALVANDTGGFVYQAMTGTVDAGLHPLPGPVPGAITEARAAAGSYIVGSYNLAEEVVGHALSWRNEQPLVLSTGSTRARGVNSQGTVAGVDDAAGRPLVWMNGVEQRLPLILPGRHLTYGTGSVVTEHNVVGGSVREVFDQDVPVYWRCR